MILSLRDNHCFGLFLSCLFSTYVISIHVFGFFYVIWILVEVMGVEGVVYVTRFKHFVYLPLIALGLILQNIDKVAEYKG